MKKCRNRRLRQIVEKLFVTIRKIQTLKSFKQERKENDNIRINKPMKINKHAFSRVTYRPVMYFMLICKANLRQTF